MAEYLIALGVVGALSLGILLWWETRKRVDLEKMLSMTEKTLALVRAGRDELRVENDRLRVLLKVKEDRIREVESQLDPSDRFDGMFKDVPGRNDRSN